MKHYLKPVFALATFAFLIATTALAETDLDELHEMHLNGEGHKLIVIKKEVVKRD